MTINHRAVKQERHFGDIFRQLHDVYDTKYTWFFDQSDGAGWKHFEGNLGTVLSGKKASGWSV